MTDDEYRKLLTRVLSGDYRLERDFQRDVIAIARQHGWLVHYTPKTRALRHVDAGYPDLMLAHHDKQLILARECKTDSGRVKREQRRWLLALQQYDRTTGVWRPENGHEIVGTLEW